MRKLLTLILSAALMISLGATAFAAAPLDGYPKPQELEVIETIPSPFEFVDKSRDPNGDGVVSSVGEWEARRQEIRDLIQHYWYGYRWPTAAQDVSGDYAGVEEPNTISVGFGPGSTINPGEEFVKLVEAIRTEGVTVEDVTYGPEPDEAAATELAIEAWNAGYSITTPPSTFWGMPIPGVTVRLVDRTGPIDAGSIPPLTKINYYYKIIIRNPDNGVVENFNVTLSVPTPEQKEAAWGDANAQVPVVIGIGGAVGAFNAQNLNPQGYALATFSTTTIYPDAEGGDGHVSRDGVYTRLYPYDPNVYEYSSGSQMAWGWAVSQIITALENPVDPELKFALSMIEDGDTRTFGEIVGIDPTRTVVTGHSRNGQSSMIAAAFDDRISICCPSEGANGSYRYKVEGKIFNFNVSYYPEADRVYGKTGPTSNAIGGTWLSGAADLFKFEGSERERLLPFDPGHLVALIAPRPYLFVNGIHQHWQGNEGIVAVVNTAAEVYDFIGANETEKNNIAVRARQSMHSFYPQDFCFDLAIMDREFGKANSADGKLHVQDLFPTGTNYANMSYPAAVYDNVSDMTSHPFEISSYYMQWSSPNKYMLWTAQDNFLTGHDVSITAHSDAPNVILVTPNGARISASSHSGEEFTFDLTADQAVYGRYELRTDGSGKENRSVYVSAFSVSDALRHGTTKGDEGEENRVLGFSSRLANDREDPPVVLIDGTALDGLNYTSDRSPKEEATLFGWGIQFHDKLFARIADKGWDETKTFGVKNLKFVTMPEYTFEFSMADIYASAGSSGKEGAARFTKPISWPVQRYNNGEAKVWPPIPNDAAERRILESGGTVTRPEGPEPWTTPFDAEILEVFCEKINYKSMRITLVFSEPLNKGEYAFGFDAIHDWNTEWNEAGDELYITADFADVDETRTANMILFRLMDLDGNLIAGPIELTVDMDCVPASVIVTFDPNGGTCDVKTQRTTREGYLRSLPSASNAPLIFAGWFTEREGGEQITIGTCFHEDTTVYAHWSNIPITDDPTVPGTTPGTTPPDPGTIPPGPDTTEPDGKVFPFIDVLPADWFYDEVRQAYEAGLVAGTTETTFSPNARITRAQMVALLWRLAGRPEAGEAPFTDLEAGAYYVPAVAWASENGIVMGLTATTFGPNEYITREQFAAIVYRYAMTVLEEEGEAGALLFADADDVSEYAVKALAWCVKKGIIRGVGGNLVDPQGTATRAQAAAILVRLSKLLG